MYFILLNGTKKREAYTGAFSLMLIFGLLAKRSVVSKNLFLLAYIIVLVTIFLFVRKYFIKGGIDIVNKYIEDYSESTKKKNRIISVSVCIFLPISLGFFLWLKAINEK